MTDYREFFTRDVTFSLGSPFCQYILNIEKTEASKRRDKLFYKMVSKKDIPYKIGRIFLIIVAFIISFGIACGIAFLTNIIEIGMMLGFLASIFCQWIWLEFIEDFEFRIKDERFIRRKL